MKIFQRLTAMLLPIALLVPSITSAAVVMPALDISLFSGDSGAIATETATGYDLDIDATVFTIVTDPGVSFDITNQSFVLHANVSGGLVTGSFVIGGGLLSGTLDNLTLATLSGSGSLDFKTDLIFTAGSLMGDYTGGRLEGIGNTSSLSAKLGAITVVPVPAAAWLFGSGLIGLIGIARRRT